MLWLLTYVPVSLQVPKTTYLPVSLQINSPFLSLYLAQGFFCSYLFLTNPRVIELYRLEYFPNANDFCEEPNESGFQLTDYETPETGMRNSIQGIRTSMYLSHANPETSVAEAAACLNMRATPDSIKIASGMPKKSSSSQFSGLSMPLLQTTN